jgi:hypothetical protein
MSLLCKKCGSREAFACSAKELADGAGDPSFLVRPCGAIDPVSAGALIAAALAAFRAAVDYLARREENNATVVVCKACGHWERVSGGSEAGGTVIWREEG